MFDMGFGESTLITEERNGLLIDCGSESSNAAAFFQNVANDLAPLDAKSLMVSHFHTDHINGLINIANAAHRFHCVYLPNIFASRYGIVDLILLRNYLQHRFVTFGTRTNLWNLLRSLITSHSRMRLLKKRDHFRELASDWTVYWPDSGSLGASLSPRTILRTLARTNDEREEPEHYRIVMEQGDAILHMIRNLADSITGLLLQLVERETPEYAEEELIRIDQLQDELFALPLYEGCEYAAKYLIDRIRGKENEYSIVCDTVLPDGKKVLFTGDVTSAPFQQIVNYLAQNNYGFYYCIKAPHHGTKSHFVNLQPLSPENVIISNGDTTRRNRGSISIDYKTVGNATVFCTSAYPTRCMISPCPCNHQCIPGDILL